METSKRIEDLLFITTNLVEVLQEENIALDNNRLDIVSSLLERKTALSKAYEIRIFGMKQEEQTTRYTELDMVNIARLKDVGMHVEKLITENEHKLKIALEVSRRFMDCVASAAQKAKPGTGAYGANGVADQNTHAAQKQAASLALDEIL